MPTIIRRTRIPAPASELFAWHARPGAFERLAPPWQRVRVVEKREGLGPGSGVTFDVKVGPVPVRWIAEHRDTVPGVQFRDVQVRGPFARWEHTHRMEPAGDAASHLEDRIDYALPFGLAGALVGDATARAEIGRLLTYRHRLTVDDLAAHARRAGRPPLHVLVSGAHGLVGSALVPFLTTGGHRVTRLVRDVPRADEDAIQWDPAERRIDAPALEGIDAVVHLAGENVAGGRWTDERKTRIRESRVAGTRTLAEALAACVRRPRTFVCASAIGVYGDRDDAILTEESAPGSGFLADVCRAWEAATEPAHRAGIRVVSLRTGVVLSSAGGALARLLPPFQLGAGGRLGAGAQWMSWIELNDVVGAILHLLDDESVAGPVNVVAPTPVTNRDFTATLGRVLGRPTLLPVPAAGARLAFGEMADAMLLASTRVVPARLDASGYPFRFSGLESALRFTLGRA